MLKRLRAAHPILYCILAEVLFLGDVYKRQLAHSAVPPACRIENLENAIGKGGLEMNRAFEKELSRACLFYTSRCV